MKNVFDILDELDNRYENKDWSINEAIELAIEETSKAKDEEELKFLFEMNSKYKLFNGNVFMNDMVKDRIDKIKKDKRRMKNEHLQSIKISRRKVWD